MESLKKLTRMLQKSGFKIARFFQGFQYFVKNSTTFAGLVATLSEYCIKCSFTCMNKLFSCCLLCNSSSCFLMRRVISSCCRRLNSSSRVLCSSACLSFISHSRFCLSLSASRMRSSKIKQPKKTFK